MFQTAGYPVHPTRFTTYDLPRTPQRSGSNAYYSPRPFSYSATSARGHTRRATGDASTFTFTSPSYSTPGQRAYYSTPIFSPTSFHGSAQSTPLRKPDHVSSHDPSRFYRHPTYGAGHRHGAYSSRKHCSTRVVHDASDSEEEYVPRYDTYEAQPQSYMHQQTYYDAGADRRCYDQIPVYTQSEDKETKSRPRRASHTSKPTHRTPPRRPHTTSKPPHKATEEDARRHRIPAGYSLKNWDPTEEPIALLGSVFDANSLGKWIYDWTVFFYGPASPMSDVAGDLWLLLIQLAGKIKRADECYNRIRQQVCREMVDDFLESGDRLWKRFTKLLRICETYMYRAAQKEQVGGKEEKLVMGKNSGCEFVDCIFGRDRELERTEALMNGMRLWGMRFDANCEDILRNPSA